MKYWTQRMLRGEVSPLASACKTVCRTPLSPRGLRPLRPRAGTLALCSTEPDGAAAAAQPPIQSHNVYPPARGQRAGVPARCDLSLACKDAYPRPCEAVVATQFIFSSPPSMVSERGLQKKSPFFKANSVQEVPYGKCQSRRVDG